MRRSRTRRPEPSGQTARSGSGSRSANWYRDAHRPRWARRAGSSCKVSSQPSHHDVGVAQRLGLDGLDRANFSGELVPRPGELVGAGADPQQRRVGFPDVERRRQTLLDGGPVGHSGRRSAGGLMTEHSAKRHSARPEENPVAVVERDLAVARVEPAEVRPPAARRRPRRWRPAHASRTGGRSCRPAGRSAAAGRRARRRQATPSSSAAAGVDHHGRRSSGHHSTSVTAATHEERERGVRRGSPARAG